MKFDKSKVYTALNADEVKVGSKGLFADDIGNLRDMVINREPLLYVKEVRNDYYQYRFKSDEINEFALFYLVEGPEEEGPEEEEPKEVTAAEWDNRPRIMKVWDDNYSKATKGKVIYIASTDETTLPVITFVSLSGTTAGHVVCYKHCAEIAATKEVKAEKSYRPYNKAKEFIADYKERFCSHCSNDSIPAIWVKNVMGALKQVISITDKSVRVNGEPVSYFSFLDAYTYPDDTPCGMEE